MCLPDDNRSENPISDLCELVFRRTGARISPGAMREMFETDWSKLSTLAHAIHNRQKVPANEYLLGGGLW